MDVCEAIRKRYSVRKYQAKPVDEAQWVAVLDAGRMAPSGRNEQNWKFIVVRDEAQRRELGEASEQAWIAHAPVIIAVVGLKPERVMFCDVPADPVDCGIALAHMMLAAAAEGLGTCCIGHFSQEACCEVLDVPPGAKIVEMLTLGYPADAAPVKKRKSLKEVVCYERFS